ncbi:MAG: rRNA maturation RNase YbeY [Verrucomicrobia bacterium]|nr:rRNA maturation RNase YbeY [Verrucomicrobiota bacterium]
MSREIEITNRHRNLRLKRRELVIALTHLDAHFAYTKADWPTLLPAALIRAKKMAAGVPFGLSAVPAGELSITFLSDPALAKLHGNFLNDPTTTDVITFEGDEALGHAGDICVSVDTALTYATRHNLSFNEELMRYVIHGWLHLAGYDDLEPQKKRRMRAAENRALKILGDAGLFPRFELKPAIPSKR